MSFSPSPSAAGRVLLSTRRRGCVLALALAAAAVPGTLGAQTTPEGVSARALDSLFAVIVAPASAVAAAAGTGVPAGAPMVGQELEAGWSGRAERARPFARLSASAAGILDSLFSRARGQLGTRYVLGDEAPGRALDCSSFARYVMQAVGVRLPRTAAEQARLGAAVPRDRDRLRPGDLLTFRRGRRVSHVGIYLGEGRFIHASPSSGRVIETTFDRNPRLLRRWTGARRLLAADDSGRARRGE